MTAYCDAPDADGDPCSRPCPDGQHVCGGCKTRLVTELDALGAYEVELPTTRYRQDTTRRQGPAVAGAGEQGLPYNDRPTDAGNHAASVMQQWTIVLLEADREAGEEVWPPEHVDGGPVLEPYARWLAARIGTLAEHPDAGMAVGDLRRACGRIRRAVDLPPDLLYAGPCDHCTEHLYAHQHASSVTCRGCGARYDLGQRRAWLIDQLRDRTATLTEIAGCMSSLYGEPVTVERLINYTKRRPRGGGSPLAERWTDQVTGRKQYLIGDVVDRIESSRVQKHAKAS